MSPGHILVPAVRAEPHELPSPLSFFSGILYAGGHGGVDIPVPVPNTEVKRPYADDTPDRGKVGSRRLFLF